MFGCGIGLALLVTVSGFAFGRVSESRRYGINTPFRAIGIGEPVQAAHDSVCPPGTGTAGSGKGAQDFGNLQSGVLDEGSEFKVTSARKKLVERHHKWKEEEYKGMPGHVDEPKQVDDQGNTIRPKYLSNHTHYSPTDPDAKISTKPGKARQLNPDNYRDRSVGSG